MYVWSIKIKQQQLYCTSMPVFIEGQVILCDRGPPVGKQMKNMSPILLLASDRRIKSKLRKNTHFLKTLCNEISEAV